MKKIFWLIALMPLFSHAQLNDGPYLLYKNNRVEIHRVVDNVASLNTIELPEVRNVKFSVSFKDHANWDFDVKLKDTILTEKNVYPQPKKIFVLSDVEGEFEGLRTLLLAGKVMDSRSKWIYGKGHLVICGDLFDRGLNVPEGMWLLYKLEDEARKAGGYVHVILGNHDVMNLGGDWRYVDKKYKASAGLMQLDYGALYGVDAELGRWLRSKNTIEKIGNGLYLHGGISPQLPKMGLSLQQINQACRKYLDIKSSGIPAEVKPLFAGATAPFWYRGYFNAPRISVEQLNQSLTYFDVEKIIVGHTITPQNIAFYFGGKVLAVDVNEHRGDRQAAIFHRGKWTKINGEGKVDKIAIVN